MKLFGKKEAPLNSGNERLAATIAARIIFAEKKIALTMNNMFADLPPKVRNTALILLSVLFAAYNTYLLISSITH